MSNKTAQMNNLVAIILVIAAAIILLGLTGMIVNIIKGSGSEAACTASAQLSSATRVAGIETVSLNCPMELKEITMDDLSAETSKAEKELNRIKSDGQIKVKYFEGTGSKILREFALDKKVAEEMRACWQKLGEGNLNLFNAWYNPLKKGEHPWYDLIQIKTPPITCVICSRIKFDKEIQDTYPDVTSIDEWLKINTVPQRGITYYDYLLDDVHDEILFTPQWNFSTKQPLAVVFARMNAGLSLGTLKNNILPGGSDVDKAVDVLYLIEYSKAGEYCDYLANRPPEEIK
jgi:hypothetical protein